MKKPQKAPGLSDIKPDPSIFTDKDLVDLAKSYNSRYLHWDRLQYYDCEGTDARTYGI